LTPKNKTTIVIYLEIDFYDTVMMIFMKICYS